MQHDNPWQHLSTKTVYEDEWIVVKNDEVVRPDNKPGNYTYINTKDSVMIIAVNKNAEIYFEWTYRYPVKTWGWELPGGGIDMLTPLETAQAELIEETGYTAKNWETLGQTSLYNGLVNGKMYYFVANDLNLDTHVTADDEEITNTGRFFSINALNEMILNSDINDSQTIAGIHLLSLGNKSK